MISTKNISYVDKLKDKNHKINQTNEHKNKFSAGSITPLTDKVNIPLELSNNGGFIRKISHGEGKKKINILRKYNTERMRDLSLKSQALQNIEVSE